MNIKNLDMMCFEDELILCCARTNIDLRLKDEIISLLSEDLDWNYLVQMASSHGLTSILYYNLNSLCPELVPDDILFKLKDHFDINFQKNLLMLGELIKILKLLKSKNIEVISYKGPVLAIYLYNNLSLREFNDLDILIHKSDAIYLKKLMISRGYKIDLPVKIDDSLYLKMDSEYRFYNSDNHIKVEFNWNFEGIFFSFPINPNFLFENLDTFKFNSFTTHMLSTSNHLLSLCIHGAKHDWNRLSWISDINQFLISNKDINWDDLLEKATKLGVKRILFINLILAQDLFQYDIPYNISKELKFDSNAQKISNDVIKRLLIDKKSLNLLRKFILDIHKRDRFKLGFKDSIYGLIKPSYADFKILPLPEYLFYLYPILRPFLLLIRYS